MRGKPQLRMGRQMDKPQESRTERIAMAVTPSERHALRFLTGHRKTTEGALLRSMLISEITAEYDRLMRRLEEVA